MSEESLLAQVEDEKKRLAGLAKKGKPIPPTQTGPGNGKEEGLVRAREIATGRWVTAYDPRLGLEICELVAEGHTLDKVCRGEGRPSRETFRRWCVKYPEMRNAYRSAREMSAHSLEEEALGLARELRDRPPSKEMSHVIRAYEVALTQLRWSAGKRNPKEYSERSQINFTVPIQINTSLPIGQEAGDVVGDDIFTIEAKVVEGETVPVGTEPIEPSWDDLARKKTGPEPKPRHRARMSPEEWRRERDERVARRRERQDKRNAERNSNMKETGNEDA